MKPTRPVTAPSTQTATARGRRNNNNNINNNSRPSSSPSSNKRKKSSSRLAPHESNTSNNNKDQCAAASSNPPLSDAFTLPETIDDRLAAAARIYGNPTNVHRRRIIDGSWIRGNNGNSLMNADNSSNVTARTSKNISHDSETKSIRDRSPHKDNNDNTSPSRQRSGPNSSLISQQCPDMDSDQEEQLEIDWIPPNTSRSPMMSPQRRAALDKLLNVEASHRREEAERLAADIAVKREQRRREEAKRDADERRRMEEIKKEFEKQMAEEIAARTAQSRSERNRRQTDAARRHLLSEQQRLLNAEAKERHETDSGEHHAWRELRRVQREEGSRIMSLQALRSAEHRVLMYHLEEEARAKFLDDCDKLNAEEHSLRRDLQELERASWYQLSRTTFAEVMLQGQEAERNAFSNREERKRSKIDTVRSDHVEFISDPSEATTRLETSSMSGKMASSAMGNNILEHSEGQSVYFDEEEAVMIALRTVWLGMRHQLQQEQEERERLELELRERQLQGRQDMEAAATNERQNDLEGEERHEFSQIENAFNEEKAAIEMNERHAKQRDEFEHQEKQQRDENVGNIEAAEFKNLHEKFEKETQELVERLIREEEERKQKYQEQQEEFKKQRQVLVEQSDKKVHEEIQQLEIVEVSQLHHQEIENREFVSFNKIVSMEKNEMEKIGNAAKTTEEDIEEVDSPEERAVKEKNNAQEEEELEELEDPAEIKAREKQFAKERNDIEKKEDEDRKSITSEEDAFNSFAKQEQDEREKLIKSAQVGDDNAAEDDSTKQKNNAQEAEELQEVEDPAEIKAREKQFSKERNGIEKKEDEDRQSITSEEEDNSNSFAKQEQDEREKIVKAVAQDIEEVDVPARKSRRLVDVESSTSTSTSELSEVVLAAPKRHGQSQNHEKNDDDEITEIDEAQAAAKEANEKEKQANESPNAIEVTPRDKSLSMSLSPARPEEKPKEVELSDEDDDKNNAHKDKNQTPKHNHDDDPLHGVSDAEEELDDPNEHKSKQKLDPVSSATPEASDEFNLTVTKNDDSLLHAKASASSPGKHRPDKGAENRLDALNKAFGGEFKEDNFYEIYFSGGGSGDNNNNDSAEKVSNGLRLTCGANFHVAQGEILTSRIRSGHEAQIFSIKKRDDGYIHILPATGGNGSLALGLDDADSNVIRLQHYDIKTMTPSQLDLLCFEFFPNESATTGTTATCNISHKMKSDHFVEESNLGDDWAVDDGRVLLMPANDASDSAKLNMVLACPNALKYFTPSKLQESAAERKNATKQVVGDVQASSCFSISTLHPESEEYSHPSIKNNNTASNMTKVPPKFVGDKSDESIKFVIFPSILPAPQPPAASTGSRYSRERVLQQQLAKTTTTPTSTSDDVWKAKMQNADRFIISDAGEGFVHVSWWIDSNLALTAPLEKQAAFSLSGVNHGTDSKNVLITPQRQKFEIVLLNNNKNNNGFVLQPLSHPGRFLHIGKDPNRNAAEEDDDEEESADKNTSKNNKNNSTSSEPVFIGLHLVSDSSLPGCQLCVTPVDTSNNLLQVSPAQANRSHTKIPPRLRRDLKFSERIFSYNKLVRGRSHSELLTKSYLFDLVPMTVKEKHDESNAKFSRYAFHHSPPTPSGDPEFCMLTVQDASPKEIKRTEKFRILPVGTAGFFCLSPYLPNDSNRIRCISVDVVESSSDAVKTETTNWSLISFQGDDTPHSAQWEAIWLSNGDVDPAEDFEVESEPERIKHVSFNFFLKSRRYPNKMIEPQLDDEDLIFVKLVASNLLTTWGGVFVEEAGRTAENNNNGSDAGKEKQGKHDDDDANLEEISDEDEDEVDVAKNPVLDAPTTTNDQNDDVGEEVDEEL